MLQVVISLDKPIRIWQHSDQPYQSMMACIIASNVPHQLVMTNRDQPGIILWLDLEESLIARWTPKAPITPFQVSQDTLKELVYPLQSCESAYQLTQTIVRKFIPAPQKAPPDERIQQVCGQIKTNITIQVSPKLDALAAHVAFSPGR